MLKGNKVYLCGIEQEDLPRLMEWRNRPDYRKFFREYREINRDMQKRWYEERVLADDKTMMFSVKSPENHELLGCLGLCGINWVHRNAELSLYIGKGSCYIDEAGLAEESCRLLFDYGYQELGMQKIWSEIYEFDVKKMALYRKLGMRADGELRNHYFYDGRWWNSCLFSLLSEEWLGKEEKRG